MLAKNTGGADLCRCCTEIAVVAQSCHLPVVIPILAKGSRLAVDGKKSIARQMLAIIRKMHNCPSLPISLLIPDAAEFIPRIQCFVSFCIMDYLCSASASLSTAHARCFAICVRDVWIYSPFLEIVGFVEALVSGECNTFPFTVSRPQRASILVLIHEHSYGLKRV